MGARSDRLPERWALAALERHVRSYFSKDSDRLLRVKPTQKANTFTVR